MLVVTLVFLALSYAAAGAQAAPTHHFLWEIEGPTPGEPFNDPCAVALDSHGDIYVASGDDDRVDVFAPDGSYLTKIETLNEPCGLAVDQKGNVYVRVTAPPPHESFGRVVFYAPGVFPPVGGAGYGAAIAVAEGEVGASFKGIATDPVSEHLYVDAQSRIQEYAAASSGSSLLNGSIGESALFNSSFGVTVEGATGGIYATRNLGGKLFKFNPAGDEVLAECDGSGAKEGAFSGGFLQNVAFDQAEGHVLVVDLKHGVVDELGSNCAFIAQIGPGFGAGARSLQEVNNVAVAVDSGVASPDKGNVYITSGRDAAHPRLYAYGPLEEPRPDVVTEAATEPTATSVTLNGSVDPNALELKDCRFEYVSEAAFEASGFTASEDIPCSKSPAEIGSGDEPVSVHAELFGLAPGAYRFRISAENENPPAEKGGVLAFGPPQVVSEAAQPVLYTEATVPAAINPEGFATSYFVEYGANENFDASTAVAELPAGASPVSVHVELTGLQPDTSYRYRVVASSAVETITGPDRTLHTQMLPEAQSCPNAQFRTGPSASLPDCRAYELVSPAQINGAGPVWPPSDADTFDSPLAAPDGESVSFMVEGTVPGSDGNGIYDAHLAVRSSSGWTNTLFSPAGTETANPGVGGVSSDQLYSFWRASEDLGSLAPKKSASAHYIRRPNGVLDPNCSPEPQGDFELVGCGGLGVDPEAVGRWIAPGASHVIFSTSGPAALQLEPNAPPSGTGAIYDRRPDGVTRVVSLLPGDDTPTGEAVYRGSSADGSAVAFSLTEAGVTTLYLRRGDVETLKVESGTISFAGLSANGGRLFYAKGAGLYAFDAASGQTAQIASGGAASFVNVAASGSRVYFISTNAITDEEETNASGKFAETGRDNLYLWDAETGAIAFVAVLAKADVTEFSGFSSINLTRWIAGLDPEANGTGSGPPVDPSRTTPNGGVLVFQSHADLTAYESEGHSEIYRYDVGDGSIRCLSCSPTDAPAESDAVLHPFSITGAPIRGLSHIQNVTDNGAVVFFQSSDRLLPGDQNDAEDVYEWREGRLGLISGGKGNAGSFLYATTASGNDVFFTTYDALRPPDEEGGASSLYDARVDGGFPLPEAISTCQGEACQGASSAPPSLPSAASTVFEGPERASKTACPKAKRRVHRGGKTLCVSRHPKDERGHRQRKHRRIGRAG